MYLAFGQAVRTGDGEPLGTLQYVFIDPARRAVTHIIIRSPRVSEEVLLPVDLVQGNLEDSLVLHAASDDLENMPRYYAGRRSSPPASRVDTAIVREPSERRASLDHLIGAPSGQYITVESGEPRSVTERGPAASSS